VVITTHIVLDLNSKHKIAKRAKNKGEHESQESK